MAEKKIKGISVEIGGNVNGLQKALNDIKSNSKATESELRKVETALRFNPDNVVILAQKQELLTQQVQNTKTKLEQLESIRAQVESQAKDSDLGAEQYRAYQREVEITKSSLTNFERKLSETQTKLQEAETKINSTDLQPLQNELSETGKSGQDFAKDLNNVDFKQFKDKVNGVKEAANNLKNDLKTTGAEIGAGLAGAGAAVVASVKSFDSVEAALNHIQAQTGLSNSAMQQYESTLQKIYKNNFGEDMTDIANVMSAVVQFTKETNPTKLQSTVESAITLRDTFGFDFTETLRASDMLIKQFGISGDEAFNLIVQGAQNGLNKNGDLLDTINEYGVHYKQLGYTAEDFFNSLSNGTEAGTFSVDKLGDAVKEFGIRTKDTSTATVEAFSLLGYSAKASSEDVQKTKDEIAKLEQNLKYAKLEQDNFNESTSELTRQKNADKIAEYNEKLENAKNKLADLTNNADGSKKSMEDLQARFAAGGDTAKAATQEVLEQLFAIDDAVLQNQIGVDLFGTMWEDLGIDGVKALTNVKGSADKTKKSMDKIKEIKYDDVSNSISGLGRQFQTDVVNKMIKKYYPQLKKGIAWTSEHLDDFVPIIKGVAREAVILYAANKANTVAKDVSHLISAYKSLRTATDSAKTAQQLLNIAQSSNVVGLIIGGVGTLVNLYTTLFGQQEEEEDAIDKLNEKYEEHREYLDEISEGYDNWKVSKAEAMTEVNGEFNYYDSLWSEMQKITDENGKIKKGYEDRAKFIAQELGGITDTEIEIVDKTVKKYDELKDTLQEVIDKKRAEAMLSSYEGAYNEALTNKESSKVQSVDAWNKYVESKKATKGVKKSNENIANALSQNAEDWNITIGEWAIKNKLLGKEYKQTVDMLKKGKNVEKEAVDLLNHTLVSMFPQIQDTMKYNLIAAQQTEQQNLEVYQELADQTAGYNRTIDYYSDLSAAIISGDSKKISVALDNLTTDFVTAENGTRNSLQAQLDDYTQKYETMKQAVKNGAEGITKADVDEMKTRKDKAQKELDTYVKLHKDKSSEAVDGACDTLNSKENTKKLEKAGKNITNSVNAGVGDTYKSGKFKGKDYGQGYLDGIGSKIIDAGEMGAKLAEEATKRTKKAQDSNSPSKKARKLGRDYGQGYWLGVDDEKGNAAKSAENIVDATLDASKRKSDKAISSTQRLIQSMHDEFSKASISNLNFGYSLNRINGIAAQQQKSMQSISNIKAVHNSPVINLHFGDTIINNDTDIDNFNDCVSKTLINILSDESLIWG